MIISGIISHSPGTEQPLSKEHNNVQSNYKTTKLLYRNCCLQVISYVLSTELPRPSNLQSQSEAQPMF
uniref:Uncharacterized protein MANES_05G042100 n=1 Tax=Rhizophora mucronata TaxID=61149 RepID=A0A2P2MEW5_RHIMU